MSDELTADEWNAVQDDLNDHLDEFRDAYGEDAHNQEIRKEADEYIVLADGTGYELNEIAEAVGVDRSALSRRMHDEARQRYDGTGTGDPWSVVDPIVIIKQ